MAKEKYRDINSGLDEFDTSLMYDDIEKIRDIEEQEEKEQNNKLSSAGLMAIIAGVVLTVATFLGGSVLGWDLFEFLTVAMPVIGFGALGYGFYKMLKLVFRKKELSFPALNVYRKTKPKARTIPVTDGGREKSKTYTSNTNTYSKSQRRPRPAYANSQRKELRRSRTNRVFSGIAGGVAEYFGISSTFLRFAFILSIFATSGSSIFLYLLLSIVLPSNYAPFKGDDIKSRR